MYSDMSTRTSASSSSNRNAASARASSVLPTPVGPRKMNEPIGRFGSRRPTRLRRTARATAATASSCPTSRLRISSSIRSSFWVSSSASLTTGMPVITESTEAIRSPSTWTSWVRFDSDQVFLSSLRRPRSSFSRSRSRAAFSYSWPWIADSFSLTTSSSFCSRSWISVGTVVTDSRARAQASSTTSMALSGKKRSFM